MPNILQVRRSLLNPSPAVVVAAATTTWNPSDKNAALTLSNGNLTVTDGTGSAHHNMRAIASRSSGKYYFEIFANTQNFASFTFMGCGNSTESLSTQPGVGSNAVVARGNGQIDFNGSSIGAWDGIGLTGQTAGIAIDLTAQKIWAWVDATSRWNSDNATNQNPATGAGGYSFAGIASGPYFPFFGMWQLSDQFTANFGATAYAIGSAPSGFGNW
jgi:hypothetical protein